MMNLKDLKRQLRRAVIDHVSDVLIDKHAPLLRLTNAASEGNQRETQKSALEFETYDQNLRNVAELACQLSTDVEGIKDVRYLAQQLEKTSKEVLFAAYILAEYPDCKKSQESLQLFKNNWIRNCDLLTSAIDNLMDVNDFLAVTEKHLESDCVELLLGYREPNYHAFKSSSNKILGRCHRIGEVVDEYLQSLSPSSNSEAIKNAIRALRSESLTNFKDVSNNFNVQDNSLDESELIASYDAIFKDIKDIRTAVLKSRNFDEVDSDNEYDEDAMTTTGHDSKSQISDGENLSKAIKKMNLDERKKIEGQMAVFSVVRKNFVDEVCKWDENGNDIILIAKQMCKIMTDMTAFTRNAGPYKKTSDIIKAAQEISSLGKRLRELAQIISDESVESFTKKDLTGYISSIDMLCTQLLITSRVKANVEQTGGDFKVINLDSVISLIQNGKNLLDVVVSTVKSAYIASTKHRDKTSNKPRFEWKMAPPQKISIIKQQETKRRHDIIRKESMKIQKAPMSILQEFSGN
uniref:Catenin alpha-2 n=1 Tax=Rhabditophanes sp. KR3021 TaxID=114890 RepID=A0AC35TMS0_9BILA